MAVLYFALTCVHLAPTPGRLYLVSTTAKNDFAAADRLGNMDTSNEMRCALCPKSLDLAVTDFQSHDAEAAAWSPQPS